MPEYIGATYPWFSLVPDNVYKSNYSNSDITLESVNKVLKEINVCRVGRTNYSDGNNPIRYSYENDYNTVKHYVFHLDVEE